MHKLFSSFLVLSMLCHSVFAATGQVDDRVYVNWSDPEYHKVVVFIQPNGYCTGQYVAPNIILTARHCITPDNIDRYGIELYDGRATLVSLLSYGSGQIFRSDGDWAFLLVSDPKFYSNTYFNVARKATPKMTINNTGFGALRILSNAELAQLRQIFSSQRNKMAAESNTNADAIQFSQIFKLVEDDIANLGIPSIMETGNVLKTHFNCKFTGLSQGNLWSTCDIYSGNSGGPYYMGETLYGTCSGAVHRFDDKDKSAAIPSQSFYEKLQQIISENPPKQGNYTTSPKNDEETPTQEQHDLNEADKEIERLTKEFLDRQEHQSEEDAKRAVLEQLGGINTSVDIPEYVEVVEEEIEEEPLPIYVENDEETPTQEQHDLNEADKEIERLTKEFLDRQEHQSEEDAKRAVLEQLGGINTSVDIPEYVEVVEEEIEEEPLPIYVENDEETPTQEQHDLNEADKEIERLTKEFLDRQEHQSEEDAKRAVLEQLGGINTSVDIPEYVEVVEEEIEEEPLPRYTEPLPKGPAIKGKATTNSGSGLAKPSGDTSGGSTRRLEPLPEVENPLAYKDPGLAKPSGDTSGGSTRRLAPLPEVENPLTPNELLSQKQKLAETDQELLNELDNIDSMSDQEFLYFLDRAAEYEKLRERYEQALARERSLPNRMLGALGIGAGGIGGMMIASGIAEQRADQNAEIDMRAYLATFRCDAGTGKQWKGGETNIELPAGNLTALKTEYVTLAGNLKSRKEQLGLKPGIESETIADSASTGLYDNVASSPIDGVYTSIANAILDENSSDATEWAEQQEKTTTKIQTGTKIGVTGVGGAMIGNMTVNRDMYFNTDQDTDTESDEETESTRNVSKRTTRRTTKRNNP